MSTYEITFITEDEQNSNIEKLIPLLKGKILTINSLGRKKFAYKINRETAGFYTSIVFQLEGDKLAQLDKKISLDQAIIRHLIIKTEFLSNLAAKLTKTVVQEQSEEEQGEKTGKETNKIEKKTIASQQDEGNNEKEISTKVVGKKQEKPSVLKTEKTDEVKKDEIKTETKKTPPVSKKEAVSEEERLAKLEEKLDELLKD